MKRFFTRSSKPRPVASTPPPPIAATVNKAAPLPTRTTALQPKYVVPPVPHPCPYDRISILATPQGLLLRPHFAGDTRSESYIQIEWGEEVKITEFQADGAGHNANWSESVLIYGIVGILSLFSGTERISCCDPHVLLRLSILSDSYLLVISSKSDVGHCKSYICTIGMIET